MEGLSCERVLYWFGEISKIPRGSGNEKAISDMLYAFAKDRGLYARQDKADNIIIKRKAAEGMEDLAPILIQGHMDMVCEKTPASSHNFLTDPIKLIYEDGFIHADNTTLGGDDGIAVAYALALLEDNTPRREIQVLITTDEEVGMGGASAVDCRDLSAKYALNIDSEEEGVFTVGCAGGMKVTCQIPMEYEPTGQREGLRLSVGGLMGGHSGVEIIKGRANANKLLFRALYELNEKLDIRVSAIYGGAKDNAIPRDAGCFIALTAGGTRGAEAVIKELEAVFNHEYEAQGENIELSLKPCPQEDKVFTRESLNRLIGLALSVPDGVIAMDVRLNMPETSNNLGVVKTLEDRVSLVCALRSAVISRKYAVYKQLKALTELAGGECIYKGNYPAWEYKSGSSLVKQSAEIFKELYGYEPKLETIHAGLECGLLSEKMQECEFISLGPYILDIHTPKERLNIASVDRTWGLIKRLIDELR